MKKKILFVINTLGRAGAETALIALLHNMDTSKYDIYLYVMLNQGEMVDELPPSVKLLNKHYCKESVLSSKGKKLLVKRIVKKMFSHGAIFKNILYIISNAMDMLKRGQGLLPDKLLWKVISDGSERFNEQFDLAVAYLEGSAAYYVKDYVYASVKAGFIHIDYELAGYTKKLDRNCYKEFTKVFTVSDEVKEHFLHVYPECKDKTSVFHNMLNVKSIIEKSKQKIEDKTFTERDGRILLLTVGRLTRQKGFDIAIKALKILADKGHNVYWVILGDGPEKNALNNLAAKEGVSKRFILAGAKENPYPYYLAADIYVHATRFEGKSIAIQEAQILGCPIIASDCSGNREQIKSGENGLLCNFNPKDIANAIESLIKEPTRAKIFGRNAMNVKVDYSKELEMLDVLIENGCSMEGRVLCKKNY